MGKRIQYRTITPRHQRGARYKFQFQGSGALDLKQRVKESCAPAHSPFITQNVTTCCRPSWTNHSSIQPHSIDHSGTTPMKDLQCHANRAISPSITYNAESSSDSVLQHLAGIQLRIWGPYHTHCNREIGLYFWGTVPQETNIKSCSTQTWDLPSTATNLHRWWRLQLQSTQARCQGDPVCSQRIYHFHLSHTKIAVELTSAKLKETESLSLTCKFPLMTADTNWLSQSAKQTSIEKECAEMKH
jgi:hypothetical protein